MPKKKKKRKTTSENEKSNLFLLKKILRGSVFSVIIFFALLLLLSAVIVKFGAGESIQNILVFIFAAISTFCGAFFAMRKTSEKGLFLGLAVAFPAVIMVSVVLLAVLNDIGTKTLIMALLMLIGGAAGGVTAVNRKR